MFHDFHQDIAVKAYFLWENRPSSESTSSPDFFWTKAVEQIKREFLNRDFSVADCLLR